MFRPDLHILPIHPALRHIFVKMKNRSIPSPPPPKKKTGYMLTVESASFKMKECRIADFWLRKRSPRPILHIKPSAAYEHICLWLCVSIGWICLGGGGRGGGQQMPSPPPPPMKRGRGGRGRGDLSAF
jgi:hypothetical protein